MSDLQVFRDRPSAGNRRSNPPRKFLREVRAPPRFPERHSQITPSDQEQDRKLNDYVEYGVIVSVGIAGCYMNLAFGRAAFSRMDNNIFQPR